MRSRAVGALGRQDVAACNARARSTAHAEPASLDRREPRAGIKLYAENCAVCHGASDGNPSNIAKGLYQKPPQFAKDGVEDDPDGITYWKVAHGIRLTGMPSFDGTLRDEQIWQVALFLKNMDALPPAPQRLWKAVHI